VIAMGQVRAEEYAQKITLLERRCGASTSYAILEPFSLDPEDAVRMQGAAKKIADFVGLGDFMFIVATARQKERVGGHIELRHGQKEVFIEVSQDAAHFEEAVLATLSHEIAHKYLHINNITCGTGPVQQYENEVLTDITAVFLGLGKLMLNGCECENVIREHVGGHVKTITKTLRSGYLNRNQLAFVYRMVCAMRKIPSTDCERGLAAASLAALRQCDARWGHSWFHQRFHEPDARRKCTDDLRSAILDTQAVLSRVASRLLYVQRASVDVAEAFLDEVHKRLKELRDTSDAMISDGEYDPCLRFLNAVELAQAVTNWVAEAGERRAEATQIEDALSKLGQLIQACGKPFPEPSLDMFLAVKCRHCGTSLSVAQDKSDLQVACPKCRYEFVADTSLPLYDKPPSSTERESLLVRIRRSLLGRG
jgi:DNA-directed RNA polymerase subunit RPC12/RpoP